MMPILLQTNKVYDLKHVKLTIMRPLRTILWHFILFALLGNKSQNRNLFTIKITSVRGICSRTLNP